MTSPFPASDSSDQDAPGSPTAQESEQNTSDTTSSGHRWYRGWGMPVLTIVVLGLALVWAQTMFDPVSGPAVVNFVTFGLAGAMVLIVLFWFCFLSYFSRSTVLAVVVPLLLVSVGWAASLRDVKFDGDMRPTFYYRWDSAKPAFQQAASQDLEETGEFVLQPGDIPAYRGPQRDGIVEGPELNRNWTAHPPQQLWRTPVGAGYASMVVVGDSLITLEQRDQNEAITCYHTQTGQLKWAYEYPARFFEAMGGLGPRSTPTIDDGSVYTLGAQGDVTCVDFFTGKKNWSRNLLQELKLGNVMWALAASPLVIGEQVIVNVGAPQGNGLMSLDRSTGATIWQTEGIQALGEAPSSDNRAGYSSPVLWKVAGVEQIVQFDGVGLNGYDPSTGRRLWHFAHENGAYVNAAQPILLPDGEQIFISCAYGIGSALVKITQVGDDWTVEAVWKDQKVLRSKFANPIYYEGFIYGLDEGILMCIDPLTGKKQWKKGRYGHGQVLLTNGQLLVLTEDGKLALGAANPQDWNELATMTVLPNASRVWNPHTLVNGVVYLRDDTEMAAYDLRSPEHQ